MTRSDYEYDYDRTELEILKRDVMGRVRATARQREAILDKFERSGVSGPKFAETVGVCYQTFAGWMQRRRRTRSLSAAPKTSPSGPPLLRWAEAEMDDDGPAPVSAAGLPESALIVEMAAGVRAKVSHASQIPLAAELARQLSLHCGKSC
jgi:hypothetical protein